MKYVGLLLFLFVLSTCALLKDSRIVDVYYDEEAKEQIGSSPLILKSLEVSRDLDAELVKSNALSILELLNSKYQKDTLPDSSPYQAVIVLKENPIIKDFESLNSISLKVSLSKPTEKTPDFIFILAEETANSISSYKYLYQILEKAYKTIYR